MKVEEGGALPFIKGSSSHHYSILFTNILQGSGNFSRYKLMWQFIASQSRHHRSFVSEASFSTNCAQTIRNFDSG